MPLVDTELLNDPRGGKLGENTPACCDKEKLDGPPPRPPSFSLADFGRSTSPKRKNDVGSNLLPFSWAVEDVCGCSTAAALTPLLELLLLNLDFEAFTFS